MSTPRSGLLAGPRRPPGRRAAGPLLALCALFALCAPAAAQSSQPDPVLARVGSHAIHRSEVERSLSALPLGEQIDPRGNLDLYVRALANEEALLQWMMQEDFRTEPELRRQVRDLVFNYLQTKYVKGRIQVSDEQVRRYYRENPSLVRGEHMRVRDLVLASHEQCVAAQRSIHSEQEFAARARAISLDRASAANGGDLGYLMKVPGSLGFETQLFDLKPGHMAIFDTPQGCHLVWVVEHIDPPLLPLGVVWQPIHDFLQNVQERELLEALVARAQAQVKVELPPSPALVEPVAQQPTPR